MPTSPVRIASFNPRSMESATSRLSGPPSLYSIRLISQMPTLSPRGPTLLQPQA